jgi:hypothetical protein
MAAPTNAFISTSAVGNRESLHDLISILNKDETPFQSMIGSGSAKATYEEWQIDSLGSATTTNYQLEGNTITALAITATTRVGNRCQILSKAFTVSATQEVVDKAGRDSEINYQAMLYGRRAKMDLESSLCQNVASSGSDPRKMGGVETWLTSNVSRGTTGSSGGFTAGNTTAPTDSSITRAPTKALLENVIKSCWDNGGSPNWLLMGSTIKVAFSTFTGIATLYQEANGKAATHIAAVDRYVSNFGTFSATASRFVRGREILVIDPKLWRVLWLRKWKKEELAKASDGRAFLLVGEATLESKNEGGSGILADLA